VLSDGSGGCDWVYNQPRLDAHWQCDARVNWLPSSAVICAAEETITLGASVEGGGRERCGDQRFQVIGGKASTGGAPVNGGERSQISRQTWLKMGRFAAQYLFWYTPSVGRVTTLVNWYNSLGSHRLGEPPPKAGLARFHASNQFV